MTLILEPKKQNLGQVGVVRPGTFELHSRNPQTLVVGGGSGGQVSRGAAIALR